MMISYHSLKDKDVYNNLVMLEYDSKLGRSILNDERGFQVRLLDGDSVHMVVWRGPGCRLSYDGIREEINMHPDTFRYAWA